MTPRNLNDRKVRLPTAIVDKIGSHHVCWLCETEVNFWAAGAVVILLVVKDETFSIPVPVHVRCFYTWDKAGAFIEPRVEGPTLDRPRGGGR